MVELFYIFWNRKQSWGSMSGEYVGWGNIMVLFLAKKSVSMCIVVIQMPWIFLLFFQIASHKRHWIYWYYSLLVIWPCSWWTTPLKSENTVSITFYHTCQAFFGLDELQCLYGALGFNFISVNLCFVTFHNPFQQI